MVVEQELQGIRNSNEAKLKLARRRHKVWTRPQRTARSLSPSPVSLQTIAEDCDEETAAAKDWEAVRALIHEVTTEGASLRLQWREFNAPRAVRTSTPRRSLEKRPSRKSGRIAARKVGKGRPEPRCRQMLDASSAVAAKVPSDEPPATLPDSLPLAPAHSGSELVSLTDRNCPEDEGARSPAKLPATPKHLLRSPDSARRSLGARPPWLSEMAWRAQGQPTGHHLLPRNDSCVSTDAVNPSSRSAGLPRARNSSIEPSELHSVTRASSVGCLQRSGQKGTSTESDVDRVMGAQSFSITVVPCRGGHQTPSVSQSNHNNLSLSWVPPSPSPFKSGVLHGNLGGSLQHATPAVPQVIVAVVSAATSPSAPVPLHSSSKVAGTTPPPSSDNLGPSPRPSLAAGALSQFAAPTLLAGGYQHSSMTPKRGLPKRGVNSLCVPRQPDGAGRSLACPVPQEPRRSYVPVPVLPEAPRADALNRSYVPNPKTEMARSYVPPQATARSYVPVPVSQENSAHVKQVPQNLLNAPRVARARRRSSSLADSSQVSVAPLRFPSPSGGAKHREIGGTSPDLRFTRRCCRTEGSTPGLPFAIAPAPV